MSANNTDIHKPGNIYGPCAIVFGSAETGTWRVVRPAVDQDSCVLCGICEMYCPADVVTTGNKKESGILEIDFIYCKGCGICANVCPRESITMIDEREIYSE